MSSTFAKEVTAKTLTIVFTVPSNTSNVRLETPTKGKNKDQKAEYNQGENKVVWTIRKFKGQSQQTLNTIINLKSEMNSYQIRKEIGPIKAEFEVNNYTASNLFIKYLRAEGGFDIRKPPQRWIRYLTNSSSYISRV